MLVSPGRAFAVLHSPLDSSKAKVYSTTQTSVNAPNIVVVPGYREGIAQNRDLVNTLGENGFNAETYDQPYYVDQEEPVERQGEVLSSIIAQTVANEEKVHAVAHSLGAGAALKAAQVNPGRFSSIILMQPAGMAGRQTFPELASLAFKKAIQKALNGDSSTLKARLAHAAQLASDPFRAVKEGNAAINYEITDDLYKVRAFGIPIHIVVSHGDEIFDYNRIDNKYSEIAELVTSYSSVADKEAGHDIFWTQPARTTKIIEQLIKRAAN